MPIPFGLFSDIEKHYKNITDDIPTAASLQSGKWFPNQVHSGTQRDAARHALWQAAMTAQYGETPAAVLGSLWELPEMLGDSDYVAMDLYNNATGRRLAGEMDSWQGIMNAIRMDAEFAEPRKNMGLFDTGPGLVRLKKY